MATSISSSPALYARIIQVLDTGDEASRKSLKEELLKILEKENSEQNDETGAKVIDRNDGLRVDKAKVDSSKETGSESITSILHVVICTSCRGGKEQAE
ncbi:hypothetical protein MKW94_013013 [Papaver nudicaule]|uniref:Uncharacterized protein n=1 Tax=Papaver nudicaule TaxID=74823 RepID=A0AA41V6R6_PAPNU|nr:hypothetical protein [Papaver nudicaule]